MKKRYEEVTNIWPIPYDFIDTWFENHQYSYIIDVIKGCKRKSDYPLLDYISHLAQQYLESPNASNFNRETLIEKSKYLSFVGEPYLKQSTDERVIIYVNAQIQEWCEVLLCYVADTCKKNYSYYQPIAEKIIALENEEVHSYCAGVFDYHRFLNDKNPRAAKIARIRHRFETYWNRLSDDDIEKKRILFIYEALKKRKIICWDTNIIEDIEDKRLSFLTSTYFQKRNQPGVGYLWEACDVDIRDRLDKRILANLISIKFKRLDVKLIGENIPDYMKDNKGRQLTLKRQEKSD